MCDKYGGVENVKELLYDILERYGNEEYFDPDLIHELTQHRQGVE